MSVLPTERPAGFWSYVHDDDDAMRGRIVNLSRLIKAEFDAVFGKPQIELFVDRDMAWGAKWKETINSALNESVFFIPIITPRFFLSQECRRELNLFSQRARSRNMPELVLPILYIKVDELNSDSEDDLKRLISETQYISFHQVRRLDEDSEPYNLKVTEIVDHLISVIREVATRPEAIDAASIAEGPGRESGSLGIDETPSLLDVTAEVQGLLEDWTATLNRLEELTVEVGEMTEAHQGRVEKAAVESPVALRLALRKYASELMPLAEDFNSTGLLYAQQIADIDNGMEPLIQFIREMAPSQQRENDVDFLVDSIRQLAENGRFAGQSVLDFADQARGLAEVSKEVRRPLALLNQGNQNFLDGQDLLDDWVRRLDEVTKGKSERHPDPDDADGDDAPRSDAT